MTNVNRLFGLMAEELIEVCYLDTKMFNDEAAEWRKCVREIVDEMRFSRTMIRETRDLYKRKRLQILMLKLEKDLIVTWGIYKDVQATAVEVTNSYLETCRVPDYTIKKQRAA